MENLFGATMKSEAAVDFLLLIASLNVRAFVLLLCCLVILKFLKGSAANRHVFISVAMLATLLLPLVSSIAPSIDIVFEMPSSLAKGASLISDEHINTTAVATQTISTQQNFSFTTWVFNNLQNILVTCVLAYVFISAMILLKVLFSNLRVCLTTICAERSYQNNWCSVINFHRIRFWMPNNVQLRHSRHIRSPMTWGIINPVILIPTSALNWDEELIKSTVLHELAHIKRRDWLTQQLAWCVCAIYWINPLTWKTLDYLHCSAETAADDMALSTGLKKIHYAENLLNVAKGLCRFKHSNYASLSITGKSSELANRITAILNPKGIHTPVSGKPLFLTLTLILFFLLPLTSIQANYRQKVNVPIQNDATKTYIATGSLHISRLSNLQTIDDSPLSPPMLPPIYSKQEKIENTNQSGFVLADVKYRTPNAKTLIDAKNVEQLHDSPISEHFVHIDNPQVIVDISSAEAFKIASDKFVAKLQGVNQPKQVENTAVASSTLAQNPSQKQVENNEGVDVPQPSPPKELRAQNPWLTLAQQFSMQPEEADAKSDQVEESPIPRSLKPRNLVTPRYPTIARQRGIEGEVTVEFDVDEDGKVMQATIIAASPSGIFDRHVIKALEKSEYQPKMIDGKAVSVKGIQEIYRFVLES